MQIWFIVSLLFSLIVAVFAVLNSDVVSINLMFRNFELSQSLVILVSAAFGAIILLFLGAFSKVKSSLKIRELTNALKNAEKKNELLSNSVKTFEQKQQDAAIEAKSKDEKATLSEEDAAPRNESDQ